MVSTIERFHCTCIWKRQLVGVWGLEIAPHSCVPIRELAQDGCTTVDYPSASDLSDVNGTEDAPSSQNPTGLIHVLQVWVMLSTSQTALILFAAAMARATNLHHQRRNLSISSSWPKRGHQHSQTTSVGINSSQVVRRSNRQQTNSFPIVGV